MKKKPEWIINDTEVEVSLGWSKIKSKGTIILSTLHVKILNMDYFEPRLLGLTLKFWEDYTKEHGCKMIFVEKLKGYSYHMTRFQYQNVTQEMQTYLTYSDFYKEVAKGSMKKLMAKTKEFTDFFEEKQKSYPMLNPSYENKILYMDCVHFYYKGLDGIITTKYENGNLVFRFGNNRYKARNEKEIKPALENLFSKVEQIVRVRNQFNPPKKYFTTCMYSCSRTIYDHQDSIHSVLMTRYNWEEIENHFYSKGKSKMIMKTMENPYSGHKLVEIMGELFLISEDTFKHYDEKDRQTALADYQNFINIEMRKRTKEAFEENFASKEGEAKHA